MSRWFRHYAGMMRDDKLVRVAIRSKQPIERVVWIWGAILESASEIDDDGKYDLDAPEIAYFLRADISDVESVLSALETSGRIGGSSVVKWGNRQFSSDTSAERQRRYRNKKRTEESDVPAEVSDARVTSPSRHRDAPELETETELVKTEAKASSKSGSGTRLPDEWEPKQLVGKTAEMVIAWPAGMIERELSKFKDHWLKTPGSRGRSLDWDASYRNWLRNADERKPRYGQSASNITSLRGSRPDPALDLIRAARDAEDREADRGIGTSLPTIRSG